jgi:hypothetical protein
MVTTPAPSRPRVLDDLADPVRAVPFDRAVGRLAAVALDAGAGAGGAVPQTSQ